MKKENIYLILVIFVFILGIFMAANKDRFYLFSVSKEKGEFSIADMSFLFFFAGALFAFSAVVLLANELFKRYY